MGNGAGNPRTPVPTRVVAAAVDLIGSGICRVRSCRAWPAFCRFRRASILAIPLGSGHGLFRSVERNVDPLRRAWPIAAIAILPLAILWLGTGTTSAIVIVAYAAFFHW
jgi:ABC-type nitrate/sulfonate/bicarbonate transport system permease component